jgi:hypothetical protein
MAIVSRQLSTGPIEIDLSGPDGNACALLGYASRFARQLGIDAKPILERMKSGDYENLLNVFDEAFGEYVTLIRP